MPAFLIANVCHSLTRVLSKLACCGTRKFRSRIEKSVTTIAYLSSAHAHSQVYMSRFFFLPHRAIATAHTHILPHRPTATQTAATLHSAPGGSGHLLPPLCRAAVPQPHPHAGHPVPHAPYHRPAGVGALLRLGPSDGPGNSRGQGGLGGPGRGPRLLEGLRRCVFGCVCVQLCVRACVFV